MLMEQVNQVVSDAEYLKRRLSPVYDVSQHRFTETRKFSAAMGNEVWLKREDQQPVKLCFAAPITAFRS